MGCLSGWAGIAGVIGWAGPGDKRQAVRGKVGLMDRVAAEMYPETFLGQWSLTRVIEDRRAGQTGGFEGEAWITELVPGRWRYREEGVMRLGLALPMAATRSYLWEPGKASMTVLFEDGRPFHQFPLTGGPGADHLCGADLYAVTYDFTAWPRWNSIWEVRGPRKDYRLESRYLRP